MGDSHYVILRYRRYDTDSYQTEHIEKQYLTASRIGTRLGIKADTITLLHMNTDEAIITADIGDPNQLLPIASDGPYEVIGTMAHDEINYQETSAVEHKMLSPQLVVDEFGAEMPHTSIENQMVTLRYRKNSIEPYTTLKIAKSDVTAALIAHRFNINANTVTLLHTTGDEAVIASMYGDQNTHLPLATDGPYEVVGTVMPTECTYPSASIEHQVNISSMDSHDGDYEIISGDDPELATAACKQALLRMSQQVNPPSREIMNRIRERLDIIDKAYKKVNIALVGITGSGKSTLINELFDCKLAEEGVGAPITTEITEYPRPEDVVISRAFNHLRLFDTRGIERGGKAADETVAIVEKFLREKNNSTDMKEHIHFVLYTVLAVSNRFEEIDRRLITMIAELGIAVIIVVTQAYGDEEQLIKFTDHIGNKCPNIKIVPVLAREVKPMGGGIIVAPYGLDTLATLIMHMLPDQCQSAFAAAQAVDVRLKVERAQSMVTVMMAIGAGLGAIPGTLFTMPPFIAAISEKIANVFDMSFKDTFKDLVGNTKTFAMMMAGIGGMTGPIVIEESINWIPIFGAAVGGLVGIVAVKIYCDKLISCLEKIYQQRNGDMAGIDPNEVLKAMVGK